MAEDIAKNARDYILLVDGKKRDAYDLAQDTASSLSSEQPVFDKVNELAGIGSQEVTLYEVVQSLGEHINHDDPAIRAKVTDYFSQVIDRLAPNCLPARHALVVCTFLCSRMEDGGAISGVAALQRQKAFNSEMAVMTFRAMVSNSAALRQRPQDQRFRAVQVLHQLMSSHRPALKALGPESATGILELVNGEKDPRNLMIIFSILEATIAEWDISPLAEAMFDSVFCYFPITFRPPPNDPYGITAADLKARLRDCIAASACFAPYAFSQLIDKLDSTSLNVKRDVLQTLLACVSSYDVVTLSNFSVSLWDSLKFEIFNSQEDDVAEETLSVVRSLAERLERIPEGRETSDASSGFLHLVCKECVDRLKEPQQKQAKSATQILRALGHISPEAFSVVISTVVPPLLSQWKSSDNREEKLATLEPFSQLIESSPSSCRRNSPTGSRADGPLQQLKEEILQICTGVLSRESEETMPFQATAVACLSSMCELTNLLAPREVAFVVQLLNSIVVKPKKGTQDVLKDRAIQGLRTVSDFDPSLIVEETLPVLLSRISNMDGPSDFESYCANLECLASISVSASFCDTSVRRLFSRLDEALRANQTVDHIWALLSTLNYILAQEAVVHPTWTASYYPRIVGVVSQIAKTALGSDDHTPLIHPRVLLGIGRLSLTIFQTVDGEKQHDIARNAYNLFADEPIFINELPNLDTHESRRQTIVLSTFLLAAVRNKTTISFTEDRWRGLLASLLKLGIQEWNGTVRQGLLQHLTLLINKFLPADMLDIAASMLSSHPPGWDEDAQSSARYSMAMFAIARALVWRLYKVEEILGVSSQIIQSPASGTEAARAFELLFAPDEVVSREHGAIIRPLSKQRAFGVCLPLIAAAVKISEPTTKTKHLLALSGMLRHIDTGLLFPEMTTIVPLLLQTLDLEDSVAKNGTIKVLMAAIQEDPATLEGDVASLINRLLKIAANGAANDVASRTNALSLLGLLPAKMKDTSLLPQRHSVVRRLLVALDDPRRQVRKAAVDCRAAWLALDDASEDA